MGRVPLLAKKNSARRVSSYRRASEEHVVPLMQRFFFLGLFSAWAANFNISTPRAGAQ